LGLAGLPDHKLLEMLAASVCSSNCKWVLVPFPTQSLTSSSMLPLHMLGIPFPSAQGCPVSEAFAPMVPPSGVLSPPTLAQILPALRYLLCQDAADRATCTKSPLSLHQSCCPLPSNMTGLIVHPSSLHSWHSPPSGPAISICHCFISPYPVTSSWTGIMTDPSL
jgi:hypothetical protein